MSLTDDSFLQSTIGDQTSSTGLVTNTAANRLAALMRNPTAVTGDPNAKPTTPATPTPTGLPNPYGGGLGSYEPNTQIYAQQAAAGGDAALNQLGSSTETAAAAGGKTDQTLTPETGNQQGGDAQAAAKAAGYAGGGIIDATGKVQGMINAALHAAALGVPYVWGGTSLNGLDCSGLLYYAARSAGLTDWKRYRAQDYGAMGTAVTADQARPGDVVYYDEGGGNGHVGLYLGNGMMVAAPQSGENVKVQKVYGTPTSYRRIFTDNQFGTVATPSGGSNWNYAGSTWTPTIVGAMSSVFGAINSAFGRQAPVDGTGYSAAALHAAAEHGDNLGNLSSPSYSGGTIGGQLVASVPYADLFQSASARYGVPASLLAAVAHQESGFNPNARSSAGAVGLMQFMPGTAAGLGVNPLDPSSAVDGAGRYLQGLYRQFGSWSLALAAYNAGAGNVRKYGGIPPFAETQQYVTNITALAQRYSGV